eukprot:8484153-Pyramimonas_sp.AAC.1
MLPRFGGVSPPAPFKAMGVTVGQLGRDQFSREVGLQRDRGGHRNGRRARAGPAADSYFRPLREPPSA